MPFSEKVREELSNETGGYCANPECKALTGILKPGFSKAIGDGAHIIAEKINGPRGQSTLTPEERAMASNGVWLCPNCHRKVDVVSPQDYPVELLQNWKVTAKQWWKKNQGRSVQSAAFPNMREQVARPSAHALQGAKNFLQFHEPLMKILHDFKWRNSGLFNLNIIIPEDIENLISEKSTPRGIGSSWKKDWPTLYHCDDKELFHYMQELIKSADSLQRPFGKYEERYFQFNQNDSFSQRIENYIDVWKRFSDCLWKHENYGL